MNTLFIAIGTFMSLLVTIILVAIGRRKMVIRTHDELKLDRDVFGFVLTFIMIWIIIVSPYVDLASQLGVWSGTVYVICIGIVFAVTRFVYKHLNHPKSGRVSSSPIS